MKIKNIVLPAMLIHLTVLCSASGNPDPVSTLTVLENTMEIAGIPGMAALVMKNGEIESEYYLGMADIESDRPVNAETLFMIASISKPVSSTALMILVQKGMVDLDARADLYLPFLIENPNFPDTDITIRHLLTHTSSLRDDWDVLDPLYTIDSGGGDSPVSLEELSREYFLEGGIWYSPNNFQRKKGPGEKYEYCNMNFSLVALIVEYVDGRSFDIFCKDEIFKPLGMQQSSWFLKDVDSSSVAIPYEVSRSGAEEIGHYGYPSYPDGQLRTSVREYSRFVSQFLNPGNGPLNTDTVHTFLSIQFPETAPYQAIAWNYDEFESFFVRRYLGYKPSHTGGDPGVATAVIMDPDEKAAVILFINGYKTSTRAIKAVYIDTLKALCREAGISPRQN